VVKMADKIRDALGIRKIPIFKGKKINKDLWGEYGKRKC